MDLKIIELFGGIGSCTEALKRLGFNVEVADYVEIDKFAVASYNAINGENFEPQNITQWNKDLKCDLIMHGSPCQDFSTAGLNKGGDENSGTRSSLLYESLRIIVKIKPKYVIWENVKNVLSGKHKPNFDKYIQKMSNLGYENYYQVLNAKDYEIPQNRERVFVVSILGGGAFNFPKKKPLNTTFRDFLENCENPIYFLSNEQHKARQNSLYHINKSAFLGDKTITPRINSNEGFSKKYFKLDEKFYFDENRHLQIQKSKFNQEKGRFIKKNYINCQRAKNVGQYFKENEFQYRKLTPLECWRLMGFSDDSFFKAQAVNSDTQLYKQAGNSIVVNVLMAIFEQLFLKVNYKTRLF